MLFRSRCTDGTLMRGDVLASWQEFVGTGELLRSVEEKVSRIRDRFVDGMTGKRTRSTEVAEAIETGVRMLLVEHAEAAAEKVSRAWAATPPGRRLVDETPGLDRASRDFRVKAERIVHDWRQSVLELVRTEGADKRMTAKFLAFGVNGIAVALMVVTFSRATVTSGTDTTTLGRRLLDAIFGVAVVDDMIEKCQSDLESRIAALFDAEVRRFQTLLQSPDSLKAHQAKLRESARQAEYARHADFLNGETTS